MGTLVNSYNLFLDTERNLSPDSNGDNIYLPLGQTPITCGSDEFIRITLQEFTMNKSWYNINSSNNVFRVADGGGEQTTAVLAGNYETPRTMLNKGFLPPLKIALDTLVGGGITTTLTLDNPFNGATVENSTNVAKIVAVYSAPHGYTAGNEPILRCYVADGKSYQLLGGKRIVDPADTTSSSWSASLGDPTGASTADTITFTLFYNAQTTTQTHAYIRVNEQNTNIATSSMSSPDVDTKRTEMSSTKVLGIVPIDTEYVRYVAGTNMVYFTNILAKQVAQLQVLITDSTGNPFPLINTNQNVLGNRFFTAVLRVDVISLGQNTPHSINNSNTEERTPARFSSGPRTQIGHLESMGLNGAGSGYYGSGFVDYKGNRIS
jgi:hypothetical protein